ncbi:MAG: hypothetical protein IH627_15140 [Rubrivivax sp.]|nr:hypothetical protein [Rubrivivax sp.]
MRKMMLAYGRRMDPARMHQRSLQGAIRVAASAARCSKAYRSLLQEHGLDPAAIGSKTDLRRLPVLTKANTFERFDLGDLARPVSTKELADVLTSSGRGGKSFGFRLTARRQHEASWFDIDLGLQDVFNVDELPTLLVNCLPMGVVFRSRATTVANVSVREDMACSILRDVGPRFAQTLLCTDPLFIRRVLDEARRAGVDWKALNTSVILGEEVLVEAQRDYIAKRMGIDVDSEPHRMIGSSFGVGELGLNLLFETRETIRIRRAMRRDPSLEQLLAGRACGVSMPSVFCYNPLRCHVEVLDPDASGYGELCITLNDPNAVIPLPRYSTGDYGRLVDRAAVADAVALAGGARPWLPVVLVCGRIADRPMGLPTVEEIKDLLYADHDLADGLSGAFRIGHDRATGISLAVQAATEAFAADDTFVRRVRAQVNPDRRPSIRIDVLAPGDFPYRPMLDFERKFRYLAV